VTDDEILLASDLYSHRGLNEFIAYDQAMCQCHDVCRCPGMTDNHKGGPMSNEPIRTVMLPIALGAFVAAGQAFLNGADTRGIVTAVLGALVLAGQEYARAHVTPVSASSRGQSGYGLVEAILIVFLVAVCLIVIFHFA
jgi:hypothetical protein